MRSALFLSRSKRSLIHDSAMAGLREEVPNLGSTTSLLANRLGLYSRVVSENNLLLGLVRVESATSRINHESSQRVLTSRTSFSQVLVT